MAPMITNEQSLSNHLLQRVHSFRIIVQGKVKKQIQESHSENNDIQCINDTSYSSIDMLLECSH
jgi:hypothetical protein